MHSIKKVEYIKAVNEKSRLLKDKREGVPPAESSPDWKKAEVHSGAGWRNIFGIY